MGWTRALEPARSDEYVRIRGDQLQPRNGRYELRITHELEEGSSLDRPQLVAVDHRADVDVFPNEGLNQPPGLHSRSPRRAMRALRLVRPDEHGHDVLPLRALQDRRSPNDFQILPIRG